MQILIDFPSELTSLPWECHANHFQKPVPCKEQMMNAIYGKRVLKQYDCLNPNTFFLKMFPQFLILNPAWCSKTLLHRWNLKSTNAHVLLFHAVWHKHHILESEFLLLLTPTASDFRGGATRSNPIFQECNLVYWMHNKFGKRGKTTNLRPDFVRMMMGFPKNWIKKSTFGLEETV